MSVNHSSLMTTILLHYFFRATQINLAKVSSKHLFWIVDCLHLQMKKENTSENNLQQVDYVAVNKESNTIAFIHYVSSTFANKGVLFAKSIKRSYKLQFIFYFLGHKYNFTFFYKKLRETIF